jgi:serine O-acetyltransferase
MRQLELSISESSLTAYLLKQLDFFYPDEHKTDYLILQHCVKEAVNRIRICFDPINSKYYVNGNVSIFNHLNGDQYASFLYFVSNNAYKAGDEILASKLFLLNKAMFGLDVFYSIRLPEHFLLAHPLGTILGNAVYGDYFVAYQGVTVGSTNNGAYPVFSDSTILYSNTSILGNCITGKNFILAANSTLINTRIEDNKVVLGNYPQNKIINNSNNLISNYFRS